MKYGVVVVPVAPVRKKPYHKFELVNQLLFGEKVIILTEKKNGWVKVKSVYDGYKGWLTELMVKEISETEANSALSIMAGDFLNIIEINDTTMHIPLGSFLWHYAKSKGKIAGISYLFNGKIIKTGVPVKNVGKEIENYARQWLNAPYLWGGKTILGIDCSGFAQTIFKLCGIRLLRDAWQQAQQGKQVKKLENARLGDLAYFDDKEEIIHVGILLGPHKIIHASGKVRIDDIDERGIINGDTGKRTHKLQLIRRMPELDQ